MSETITWLTSTPLGLAATIGGLLVLFILIALLYERKTRKLYPDRNRRGTKAVAKAKAKKKKAKEAAKEEIVKDAVEEETEAEAEAEAEEETED